MSSENCKRRSSPSESVEESVEPKVQQIIKALIISSSSKTNLVDSQLVLSDDGIKRLIKLQDSPKSLSTKLADFEISETNISNNLLAKEKEKEDTILEAFMVIFYFLNHL